MATLVVFHAHPDDEAIATGGVMARAVGDGHRVVLVVATRGELGEIPESGLAPGETLWERRVAETNAAAALLGVSRVEFLGYKDSGMAGTPENEAADAFCNADVDEAAQRLADILIEERADVLTAYDERGVYGHPDHVQVHRVGVRAGELAGTPKVYLATVNKDHLERAGFEVGDLDLGVREDRITTTVDVRDLLDVKRAAMAAHASQIGEASFFLTLPPDQFEVGFGQECFILVGAPAGTAETSLFEDLNSARS